jgi:hypothetical protein
MTRGGTLDWAGAKFDAYLYGSWTLTAGIDCSTLQLLTLWYQRAIAVKHHPSFHKVANILNNRRVARLASLRIRRSARR